MVFKKLRKIIAETLSMEENEIELTSRFKEDLGADSLDIVQIAMGVQDEFEVTLDEEDLEDIKNVEDAVEAITDAIQK